MSEALRSREVIVGVDTHKHVHAAVAIKGLGARLGATTIPGGAKGYRELEVWACSLGAVRAFGIEGTGSYGAGLSRFLHAQGHAVLEVNRPNRQLRRQQGKSDPLDAEAAARSVLAGQAAGLPKSGTGSRSARPVIQGRQKSEQQSGPTSCASAHKLGCHAASLTRCNRRERLCRKHS